jgi:hypothetical protein
MDDLPDKLRRNVVVLSAAILAIAFFDLSFKPTGTLLGFAEVGNVGPLKVWLALTVVLAYVVTRYHHSEDTQKERTYVGEEFVERRRVALLERVDAALRSYFLNGVPVRLFDDFAEFVDVDIEQRMTRDGTAKEVESLSVGTVDLPASQAWWQGRVDVNFYVIWAGSSYGRSGGTRPAFTLPRYDRIWVTVVAVQRTLTHSRVGVDIGLPYAMAAVSALTSLYKLGSYFPH